MASPDIGIGWTGSCSAIWESIRFGVKNNATIETLSFRQKTLTQRVGYNPVPSQIFIENCSALTSISFPNLTRSDWFSYVVYNNPALQSIDFPVLDFGFPNGTTTLYPMFAITANPSLTSISFPLATFGFGAISRFVDWNFSDNALTQASVDMILNRLALSTFVVSSWIILTGGTNSAPSAAGLADVAILNGRGCTVFHN